MGIKNRRRIYPKDLKKYKKLKASAPFSLIIAVKQTAIVQFVLKSKQKKLFFYL